MNVLESRGSDNVYVQGVDESLVPCATQPTLTESRSRPSMRANASRVFSLTSLFAFSSSIDRTIPSTSSSKFIHASYSVNVASVFYQKQPRIRLNAGSFWKHWLTKSRFWKRSGYLSRRWKGLLNAMESPVSPLSFAVSFRAFSTAQISLGPDRVRD